MFSFVTKKENRKRSAEYYRQAISTYRSGEIDDAIFALAMSVGADPQPEAYRMLGHLYTAQSAFRKAAGAHFDGRRLALHEPGLFRTQITETVMEFYHDEALAYLRDGDWEFVQIRSNAAIGLIRTGQDSD